MRCKHDDKQITWNAEGVFCMACDALLDITKEQDLVDRNKRSGQYRDYWTDGCTKVQKLHLHAGLCGERRFDDLSPWTEVRVVGVQGEFWGLKWLSESISGISNLSVKKIQWELRQGKLRFYATDKKNGPVVEQPVE